MQNDVVSKNYAEFIHLPKKNETSKSRFTDLQLETLCQNIGTIPYADYIFAMCYLNFRISEFLELTSYSYHVSESGIPVFVGGKKRKRERIVLYLYIKKYNLSYKTALPKTVKQFFVMWTVNHLLPIVFENNVSILQFKLWDSPMI